MSANCALCRRARRSTTDRRKTGTLISGFAAGFFSPGRLLVPHKLQRSTKFDGSVERAWTDVNRALSEATKREGATIGKTGSTGGRKAKIPA
jgi:hypothetical protein